MGQLCDFCGEQRSMIHCRSDSAFLCLSCDRNIHSANALSKRHLRTLVCERCHSEPAVVGCINEKISLCQNCNWSGHAGPASATEHKRQSISCYSGCPSASEFSRIWSFFSVDQSTCDPEAGSIILEEEDDTTAPDVDQVHGRGSLNPLNQRVIFDLESFVKYIQLESIRNKAGSFAQHINSLVGENTIRSDSPAFILFWLLLLVDKGPNVKKACSSRIKHLGSNHDSLYQDFDTLDIDLSLVNYDALFDESIDDPQQVFDNGEIDSLFEMDGTDWNMECVHMSKASSSKSGTAKQACSNQVSAESTTSCKSDRSVIIPRQAQSTGSLSFSGPINECNIEDPTECLEFATVMIEEHPCNILFSENQFSSAGRNSAVLRYREKKKSRQFNKRVRYASRKERADVRKRVKGRFVKAGEFYDYDPMNLIISQ